LKHSCLLLLQVNRSPISVQENYIPYADREMQGKRQINIKAATAKFETEECGGIPTDQNPGAMQFG